MADTKECDFKARSRSVVFNADDFGYTSGINEAVGLAHRAGLLKSASLMMTGRAYGEAVDMALRMDDFEVGVHLSVTQTRACLPAIEIPDLVEGPEARFKLTLPQIGVRLFYSSRLVDQIVREWRAQIERVIGDGLQPDHLNSHQHLHMHPALFGKVLELAEEFKIPVVRMPHANLWLNLRLDSGGLGVKVFKAAVFGAMRSTCLAVHRAGEFGVYLANRTYGLLQIGRTNEDYLVNLLPQIPSGLSEIYVHPGMGPEPCSPRIRRDMELAALLSPRVRDTVEDRGLEVTTFRKWVSMLETEASEASDLSPLAMRG